MCRNREKWLNKEIAIHNEIEHLSVSYVQLNLNVKFSMFENVRWQFLQQFFINLSNLRKVWKISIHNKVDFIFFYQLCFAVQN